LCLTQPSWYLVLLKNYIKLNERGAWIQIRSKETLVFNWLLHGIFTIYAYYRRRCRQVQHLADTQVQHQAHQKFRMSHDWWYINRECTWWNMCTLWIDGPHWSGAVSTGQKERRQLFVFLCASHNLLGIWCCW
jgi:hypothetical protein